MCFQKEWCGTACHSFFRFVDAFLETAYHRQMVQSLLTTLLFDLDGTLLPMDQHQFARAYFALFRDRCCVLGYDGDRCLLGLQKGMAAMLYSDGRTTNQQRFEAAFQAVTGIGKKAFNEGFSSFYSEEFHQLSKLVTPSPVVGDLIRTVLEKGYTVVLATTPVFPREGTLARLQWAGLEPDSFTLITTYEDYQHAKPDLGYYQEICSNLSVKPEECLMIGNDVVEDMVALQLGMDGFLVTDCLINTASQSLVGYRTGSLLELDRFCKELMQCKQNPR